MVYQDVRKFGTFDFLPQNALENFFLSRKIGPEPTETDFKLKDFEAALLLSQKPIKPNLLEQKLVAGLGNIYVDEVLFASKVHPARKSCHLKKAEMKRIHDETIRILKFAIEKVDRPLEHTRILWAWMAQCRTIYRFTVRQISLVHGVALPLKRYNLLEGGPIFVQSVRKRSRVIGLTGGLPLANQQLLQC